MAHQIKLAGWKSGAVTHMELPVVDLVLGGWTARNPAALEAHIRELAALGVAAPAQVPVFYRVASSLITTASTIDVIGTDSTGEVEFVLFHHSGEIWVGVGSDQTDRKAEAIGITLSKQLCAKPISSEVWAFSEIEAHWDELKLRSYTESGGKTELYQEDHVSVLRHPRNLLELYRGQHGKSLVPGTVMFSGTPAARRKIEWAEKFVIELEDPVLGRLLKHAYEIRPLRIEG